jgi:hypothetical protein
MNAPLQTDLFGTADPLIGLEVELPNKCTCGSNVALIGAGKAMHKASLHCRCGKHRGWLSNASYNFVRKIVETLGRPQQPIAIHRGSIFSQIAKQDEYLKRKFTPDGRSWYDVITEASGFDPSSEEIDGIAPTPIDAGEGN